jgi:molybdopterin molybdotransferase
MHGRVPVVGLPGNPVSAMVTFEVFVKPGLLRMLGHERPHVTWIDVELAHAHSHATGRTELARARLTGVSGQTRPRATLHSHQGSGSLPAMCDVDALLILDAERPHFELGAVVPALPMRGLSGQSEPLFR